MGTAAGKLPYTIMSELINEAFESVGVPDTIEEVSRRIETTPALMKRLRSYIIREAVTRHTTALIRQRRSDNASEIKSRVMQHHATASGATQALIGTASFGKRAMDRRIDQWYSRADSSKFRLGEGTRKDIQEVLATFKRNTRGNLEETLFFQRLLAMLPEGTDKTVEELVSNEELEDLTIAASEDAGALIGS